MEKQGETPLHFPPYRRSHLESETYRTFVRIMSHCYGQSQVSLHTPQLAPQLVIRDNGGDNSGQAAENGVCKHGPLVDPGCKEPGTLPSRAESCEAIGFKGPGFSETQNVIDEIDQMMITEGIEDFLKCMDMVVDDDTAGTGSQAGGSGQQQALRNELMECITGNEEIVHDNDRNSLPVSLDNHQNDNDGVALLSNLEANFAGQQPVVLASGDVGRLLVDKQQCEQKVGEDSNSSVDNDMACRSGDKSSSSGDLGQPPVDKQHGDQKIGEDCNSSVDRDMTTRTLRTSENSGDKSSSLKTNTTEVQHSRQQKELETGNSVFADDVESEEGEISGDFDIDDNAICMSSEEAAVLEEKKENKVEVSENVIRENEFAFNQQSEVHEKDSKCNPSILDTVDNVNTGKKVELELSGRRNLVYYGEILENTIVGDQGVASKVKEDTGVCNKKKRGAPSNEKKLKKKQRERKKRAEKNRQLGVKRIKLETVLKPKPVTVCRHYLKGRCHEGDQCKFSHEAVPLTKSEPCRYFVRHLCMKGDDCPFDHQLSKYPCINFATTGDCIRGDNCMFSHQIPLKEDKPSASNICQTGLKSPSLLGNPNTKVKVIGTLHQNVYASSNSMGGFACKNAEQNMAETVPKQHVMAPKGISFLSMQKSSMVDSSKLKQGSSSPNPKGNQSGKVPNQKTASISGTIQNMNEIPEKTTPAVAPKGINFLSFSNAPLKDSSTRKLSSLPFNGEDSSMKSSLLNKFNVLKHGSSTPHTNEGPGKQTSQSASTTTPKSNEMLTMSQPAVRTQEMNFPSIGNALVDESRNQQLIQNSLRRLSASPLASCQEQLKSTPNSAQKALMSTLAFAAKFESQMKINRASASTSNAKERGNSCGISQNVSDKASKILKFLSTPGSELKQ